MAENTKIQWADDSVNVWWGCTHRGPGCLNCYAETFTSRVHGKGAFWGPNKPRLYCKNWEATLRKLNAKAEKAGAPRVVFVNSMSDFFEDDRPLVGPKITSGDDAGLHPVMSHGPRKRNGVVGEGVVGSGDMLMWPHHAGQPPKFVEGYRHATTGDLRTEFFRVADECTWLRLLLLTKRPENVRRMWPQAGFANAGVPGTLGRNVKLDNVWLGTSIACQEDADRNVPELRKSRDLCAKTFLSIEPLIGPVNLMRLDVNRDAPHYDCLHGCDELGMVRRGPKVDWVIVGGESGPNARPCDIAWVRSIVAQCKAAGVPCFVKQLGASPYDGDCESIGMYDGGCGHSLCLTDGRHALNVRDPKGGDPAEWPEDIRVREVP